MSVIYCFGDSITYGAWDVEHGGWAARLRKHLDDLQAKDDKLYFLTYCLGIPGETTDGLVSRFDNELRSREREGQDTIFIFAFGANDSVYMPSKKEFRVPKDCFVSNLASVIAKAERISDRILLVNITPVDEALCTGRYGGKDKVRLNSNIREYNALLSEFAKSKSLRLVDIYSKYASRSVKELLSDDGLHPNEAGHELIFQEVKVSLGEIVK